MEIFSYSHQSGSLPVGENADIRRKLNARHLHDLFLERGRKLRA